MIRPFSPSGELPKSPTMSMSVRFSSAVCVRTSRPNHSPEPGPIEVASR